MKRIHLTIDRMTLAGFDAADRTALVEGLRSEFARILADPAARAEWMRSRRMPVLRLGQMQLQPGPSGSRKFGGNVARAIGRRLKP